MSCKTACFCYPCFSQAFNSTVVGKKVAATKNMVKSPKACIRIGKKNSRRILLQTRTAHLVTGDEDRAPLLKVGQSPAR